MSKAPPQLPSPSAGQDRALFCDEEGRTYRPERELGRGVLTSVDSATLIVGGRAAAHPEFAIKTVLPLWVGHPLAEARIARERELSAAIHPPGSQHPFCARIIGAGRQSLDNGRSRPFHVTALLSGRTLAESLRLDGVERETETPEQRAERYPQRVARMLGWTDHLLSALARLHSLGWVHRDVKPQNVFLERHLLEGPAERERAVLIDFGLAVRVGCPRIDGDEPFGTPAYVAPELIAGEKLDGRADIYSLGLVLYEALAGRRPFSGTRSRSAARRASLRRAAAAAELRAGGLGGAGASDLRHAQEGPRGPAGRRAGAQQPAGRHAGGSLGALADCLALLHWPTGRVGYGVVRRLLLFKTGQTDRTLKGDIGDYEEWFGRVLGERAHIAVHDAVTQPSVEIAGFDGMMITGSPRSLVEPEPWMPAAAETVRRAATAGVPVLGVCFGHQLIAYAFGARVRTNPNGWEFGTREVELTDDGERDPLFAGLPRRVRVNQSHRDEVWELGKEIRRLAGSVHTETQALAVGSHVRGVQFHPEMSGKIVRRIIEYRRPILEEDLACRGRCRSYLGQAVDGSSDTPHGEQVLRHFLERFVRAA